MAGVRDEGTLNFPFGICVASAGYPGVPHLKALYDWIVPRWRSDLAGCTHVAVDIKDGHLEKLMETVLNDLRISYDFRTERRSIYVSGTVIPATVRPGAADCMVSDRWKPAARTKLIYLSTSNHENLLQSSVANGLHGIEPLGGEILRWTDGNAQWITPGDQRIAAINISFWPGLIPPGTSAAGFGERGRDRKPTRLEGCTEVRPRSKRAADHHPQVVNIQSA